MKEKSFTIVLTDKQVLLLTSIAQNATLTVRNPAAFARDFTELMAAIAAGTPEEPEKQSGGL